jgi:hypothetical protein
MMMRSNRREGFALLTVILVLAALLMLLTPFLVSARNTDQGSSQLYDRALTRAALETARLHVRAELERSHFGIDPTAYSDSIDELTVSNRFPDEILNASDHIGVMWDVEVTDLAGRVDLSSAPPQLISNLMGATTRLTRPIESEDDVLPIANTAGMPSTGVVVIGGEFIHYGGIEAGQLTDVERGLGATYDEEGNPLPGPRPPSKHGVGAPVLDQRAYAPVQWRLDVANGDVRPFTTPEQLEQLDDWVVREGGMGLEVLESLRQTMTVHGGVGAGSVWQQPMRLTSALARDVDHQLRVDAPRYVNEGSTIRVRDGEVSEVFVVTRLSRSGGIYLDRAAQNDYSAYSAVVEVQSRRPVNINTAPLDVLQAVMTNLQIRGRNDRITESEARQLAVLIGEMRPFDDFEQFLTWVVLPAAGIEKLPSDAPKVPDSLAGDRALIDAFDALALYTNALNANDSLLSFSTVPFCLRSRDVYRADLRAMVNAPSGVARHEEVREEVSLIVPQEELMHIWQTQEDFDEALRIRRNAPWWSTGPEATSQYDGEYSPPSRLWPAMGTHDGQVFVPGIVGEVGEGEELPETVHTFASDEGIEHWAQLWPARLDETGERSGRVMHFDREVRDLEGRSLLDEVVAKDPEDSMVQWSDSEGLMRQIGFSLWVKPRSHADGLILDIGGGSEETDRLSLMFDQGELVLRVIAAGGDHSGTTEKEYGECRYALSSGDGPGLPIDTWSHIAIDVRGSSPNQMLMLVNGSAHGVKTPGLSRLSSSVSDTSTFLPLEDTTGFPARGVARVGNELVEYTLGSGGLDCRFNATGSEAGFGGRNARCRWDDVDPPAPTNLATVDMFHPAGTPVEIYGYSSVSATDMPSGSASLPDDLGRFRVACVKGVEGGSNSQGDPILLRFNLIGGGTVDIPVGFGMTGSGSAVTGLRLGPAEDPEQDADTAETMQAFNPTGGYAAIIQQEFTNDTPDGSTLGGIEVIRYSGWDGDVLQIAARGDTVNLPNLASAGPTGGARTFVSEWTWVDPETQTAFQSQLDLRTFVVPISVPVPGASGVRGFLQGAAGEPQFAQFTRLDAPEQTEWVAYNYFDESGGFLVRDDGNVLNGVYLILVGGDTIDEDDPPVGPGGGGGGGGGTSTPPGIPTDIHQGETSSAMAAQDVVPADGPTPSGDFEISDGGVIQSTGDGDNGRLLPGTLTSPTNPDQTTTDPVDPEDGKSKDPTKVFVSATTTQTGGSYWEPFLGEPDDESMAITRAVRSVLQHRGVMGTAPQSHPAGTQINPVFSVNYDEGFAAGTPGRFDQIFVFGPNYDHLGWPVEVHRGHAPSPQVQVYSWQQADPDTPIATDGGTASTAPNLASFRGGYFVALTDPQPEPIPPGTVGGTAGGPSDKDSRGLARIAKFPTGERPRIIANAMVGGSFRAGSGSVPEVVVDEVLFSDTDFGTSFGYADPDDAHGAQLILLEATGEQELRLRVRPGMLRLAIGDEGANGAQVLGALPSDAGLLYLGTEIVAYDSFDSSSGEITLAPNGRGLLGTDPQPHGIGEPVTFLSHFTVTTLSGGISGDDGSIPLESTDGFPAQGTILIGDELIHYTRQANGGVEMPTRSSEPGEMDGRGSGIFRGRFGTSPAAHGFGEPVILFPIRYWDRWAERADAPEMAYFEFELNQPAAFWTGMFFEDEAAAMPGAEMYVLQRTDPDVPWDADPESTDGLDLIRVGIAEGREVPIGVQSDLIQWRVFVHYPPGAYDPNTAASHSWRTTPRLRRIGAFYYAPCFQLRSVER